MNRYKAMAQNRLPSLILAGLCLLSSLAPAADIRPAGPRCEYRLNPQGIDVLQPRLSWTLQAATDARGLTQSAYHILAASSPEKLAAEQGDLWDSGKIKSDSQLHIAYAGEPLTSRMQCYWKVRVWDQNDKPSEWSEPAFWTMGLLQPSDWQAKWIADPDSAAGKPAPKPINGYHSEIANAADTTKWVAIDLGKQQQFEASGYAPPALMISVPTRRAFCSRCVLKSKPHHRRTLPTHGSCSIAPPPTNPIRAPTPRFIASPPRPHNSSASP